MGKNSSRHLVVRVSECVQVERIALDISIKHEIAPTFQCID